MNDAIKNHNSNHPDEYLPLHNPAVRRATGVSARTLKSALLEFPGQFASDAFQFIELGDRQIIRFNPARHVQSLKEKSNVSSGKQDGIPASEMSSRGASSPRTSAIGPSRIAPAERMARSKKALFAQQAAGRTHSEPTSGAQYLRELLKKR